MKRLESFVEGKWISGSENLRALYNPCTAEQIAECSSEGLNFKDITHYGTNVGGANLRILTFAGRGAILKILSKALYSIREELIEVSIENMGATRGDAKFDIDGATGTLAAYAKIGMDLGDRTYLMDDEGEQLTRSPRFYGYHVQTPRHGVAVHINAFNFPVWGMCEKLATSLLAGVATITKPATSSALIAYEAMKCMVNTEALPEGALQFIAGGVGDLLDHLGGQDMVAFTGGADTGFTIRSNENLLRKNVRVNIEADSLNAAVLGDDVEAGSELYSLFLRHISTEMSQKAGQKCTGTRRIFVPEALIPQFEIDISEELSLLKIGHPKTEGVRCASLASKSQQKSAFSGLKGLQEDGATIIFGGPQKAEFLGVDSAAAEKGAYFAPTLLKMENATKDSLVHKTEVFAPVSTVLPYASKSEMLEAVALGGGGLLCTVYTNDKKAIPEYIQNIAAYHGRMLLVNDKIVDQCITPGMVLPSCLHGGPGRAGGGEELGGLRGLNFYMQRTAIQGDRGVLSRIL